MSNTHKDVWVVRRREKLGQPYRMVCESPNKETALAEFQLECRRELECDPAIETRDIDDRIPSLRWSGTATFEPKYNGVKIRIFESRRKV